jgi:hypothetical protein
MNLLDKYFLVKFDLTLHQFVFSDSCPVVSHGSIYPKKYLSGRYILSFVTFEPDSEYHVCFECKPRRDLGSKIFFEAFVRTEDTA